MTSSAPGVTIVVPVYNGAKHLRECLDSLVNQTWRHRDILVMDDASTDETPRIVEGYGKQVDVVRQVRNRGQFQNVEDGIARARGRYVAVYHADDVYDPEIVAREVAFLEAHPDVGTVFCLDRFLDEAGREYGRLTLPASLRGRTILDYPTVLNGILEFKNVFLPTPGAMARIDCYRAVGGFRTEFGSAADLDMWLRLARHSPVGVLEEHLFGYRHSAGSQGQSYQALRTDPENYFAVMARHLDENPRAVVTPVARRAHAAHRAVDHLRAAVNGYILGRLDRGRSAWRAVRVRDLLGSRRIRRPRHLVLWVVLGILFVLPRLPAAAHLLHWRYYRRLPWWAASA
jgi:GT2 family glycosyltransferase